jgi:hypothetical protein
MAIFESPLQIPFNVDIGSCPEKEVFKKMTSMSYELEYVNCIICGKDDTKLVFKARDRWFDLPGEFNIVKCKHCGLVYLNPRPTKKSISFYYPEGYEPHKSSQPSQWKRKLWKAYINLFGQDPYSLNNLPKGRVLDIGCGG